MVKDMTEGKPGRLILEFAILFTGKFIPAVLQSGGYCDRWKVSGRGSAGGGRLHRLDQLF